MASIFMKDRMVMIIAAKRTTLSMLAATGTRKPKNRTDQSKLCTNCEKYSTNGVTVHSFPLLLDADPDSPCDYCHGDVQYCQDRCKNPQRRRPERFPKHPYHESTEPDVMREPTAPTPRVTPRKRITDQILEKFFPVPN